MKGSGKGSTSSREAMQQDGAGAHGSARCHAPGARLVSGLSLSPPVFPRVVPCCLFDACFQDGTCGSTNKAHSSCSAERSGTFCKVGSPGASALLVSFDSYRGAPPSPGALALVGRRSIDRPAVEAYTQVIVTSQYKLPRRDLTDRDGPRHAPGPSVQPMNPIALEL